MTSFERHEHVAMDTLESIAAGCTMEPTHVTEVRLNAAVAMLNHLRSKSAWKAVPVPWFEPAETMQTTTPEEGS